MENLANNNINGQQRRFPATNQVDNIQWLMNFQESLHWQLLNISGYRMPENAGWDGEQAMATMMPSSAANFDMINFCNQQQQPPLINNSSNRMYMPLQVIPEQTRIPLPSVPAMPMPIESDPPIRIRKKAARRWSPEEHKLFLIGLKKFKKGDWKSISRNLVITRSATQVASHAQKYFNRPGAGAGAKAEATASDGSRKKRSSIHDTRVEDVSDDPDAIKSLQDIINDQHFKSR